MVLWFLSWVYLLLAKFHVSYRCLCCLCWSFGSGEKMQTQARTLCKQKEQATRNGRHSLFYAEEMHCSCPVANWEADMTTCCWQRWKPQDSRTCLLQKRSALFVLISITHTCESVENPEVLCVSILSSWTMSWFTKTHTPATTGLSIETVSGWR